MVKETASWRQLDLVCDASNARSSATIQLALQVFKIHDKRIALRLGKR
jgi:hypothetical protein